MSEDTFSPLICEERPDSYPDVTITIPGDLAAAIVQHGPALIETIGREQRLALIDDEAHQRRHQELLRQHQDRMALAGVQAYRKWRRILASTEGQAERNRHLDDLCAELAKWHGPYFNREFTRHIIQERKAEVAAYIETRHVLTLVRMFLDGASNKAIAARLGISPARVGKMLTKHADAVSAARKSRRKGRGS